MRFRRRHRSPWVEQCAWTVREWERNVLHAPTEASRTRAERVLSVSYRILRESQANPSWGAEGNAQGRNADQIDASRLARRFAR